MLTAVTDWIFAPSGLTPHGFCLLWEPSLIWMHALADITIGLSYFSIPLALATIARERRDLVFRPVFWLFATFIMLCGTTHWLALLTLWIPAYTTEGAVKALTGVVSVVTAITLWRLLPQALALPSPLQLQDANRALQESEARHRASFERSPVPMHTLDRTGRITGVSDTWLALLGYRREDVVGRSIGEFQPEAASWSDADLRRLLAEGEAAELERRFLCRDGRIVETLISARTEQRGDETWAVCAVIDITARRQTEEALRLSEERLHQAQKMEAVGQLTGGIAHDFNNMLQGIAGGLDLMDLRIAQGRHEQAVAYIGVVRQSLDRAAGLTHRMLAFARRQTLEPRLVEPDMLVQGLEELIRRTVGPTIQVRLDLKDGKWPALCDPNQLESAIVNLAINARDAMPEGGHLTIATADRHMAEADLSHDDAAPPGDYVEFAVIDTGAGMNPSVLARAFEPFFTTKPTGQGTGLGLSQLYGFIRQSGGFVRLSSTLGQGTVARLYLPRHHAAAAEEERRAPDPAASVSGAILGAASVSGTVLVVDDEQAVRAQIVAMLEDIGLRVLEAADGPSALEILQSSARVHVLVTDVGLPGLNGRQLAEAARARRPGLPVVLITGYAGTALDDVQLPPGFEVLRKPFALQALAARVRAVLEPVPVG